MSDIVLACMPFGAAFGPSLGLSLLKGGLGRHQDAARIRYFTIRFAELVGQDFYFELARGQRPSLRELAGEWIFSSALFGDDPGADDRYIEEILRKRGAWTAATWERPVTEALIERVLMARAKVPAFLDECVEEVLAERPRLVGFTSVLQQHVASLALARRIKEVAPDVKIVFGGANCEGLMGAETVRSFPFVDAAVSGEADVVFPDVVTRVLAGEPLEGLAGVRTALTIQEELASRKVSSAPMVRDMDTLPYPDFDDFFEQWREGPYHRAWKPWLFLETSRGCWWGEKQHCTFCGLNGTTMAFRSKTPRRAVDEMIHFSKLHPGLHVNVSDNIIDMGYFKTVLPELAARGVQLDFFYETKANLRKSQVRIARDGGVLVLQPGIESFSDSVLRLMRKGVSALQNIQLLKWCMELGVKAAYNLLWGFPGEEPEEYARMARLVPWLAHLTPPSGYAGIRLDRFSPNFNDADEMGFVDVKPLRTYEHVYRLGDDAVANLAYYFRFAYRDGRKPDTYARPLLRQLREWKRAHASSELLSVDVGSHLLLWDLRPAAIAPLHVLDGLDREVHDACGDVKGLTSLRALRPGADGAADIERSLQSLVARGLVLADETRYLSLAVPLGEYQPSARRTDRLWRAIEILGRRTSGRFEIKAEVAQGHLPAGVHENVKQRSPTGGRRGRFAASQFAVAASGDVVITVQAH